MIFQYDSISATSSNNWLVTLTEANNYIREKQVSTITTALSGFLVSTIQIISDKFDEYVGHGIKAQNYIGYYNGTGSSTLYTENYPISYVSTVQYRNNPTDEWRNIFTGSATANIIGNYNSIYLYGSRFPCGRKNIKIEYIAGHTNTPGDIKQCALEAIQEHYNNSKYGNNILGVKSKSTGGDVATTYSYEDLWSKHQKILDSYRTIHI